MRRSTSSRCKLRGASGQSAGRAVALAIALLVVGAGGSAVAELYAYTDDQGVKHFTNIPPPRGKRQKWRMLSFGPGKAQSVSGAAATARCRISRADVVPARDTAKERFVRYDDFIAIASRMYAIPEALIRAVIKVESDYDPRVVSCAGARGLMQLMPYEITKQRIEQVFDPWQNIAAGTRILRRNANYWKGDISRTIASYHAGIGAVRKYDGVPPYATTRRYVKMVLERYERYRAREFAETDTRPRSDRSL